MLKVATSWKVVAKKGRHGVRRLTGRQARRESLNEREELTCV